MHPLAIVALVFALNCVWLTMLNALESHFASVSEYRFPDVQINLSPEQFAYPSIMLEQIGSYSEDAKMVYWIFFMLDNIMPPLVFGSFSFLWARLLNAYPDRLSRWIASSYILLIPFGVGFFDCLENLANITAIHNYPDFMAMRLSMIFNMLKVMCLLPTFLLSAVFSLHWAFRAGRNTLFAKHSAQRV
jgi:hypothetical protein